MATERGWTWKQDNGKLLGLYRVLKGEGMTYIVHPDDALYDLVPRIAEALNLCALAKAEGR